MDPIGLGVDPKGPGVDTCAAGSIGSRSVCVSSIRCQNVIFDVDGSMGGWVENAPGQSLMLGKIVLDFLVPVYSKLIV